MATAGDAPQCDLPFVSKLPQQAEVGRAFAHRDELLPGQQPVGAGPPAAGAERRAARPRRLPRRWAAPWAGPAWSREGSGLSSLSLSLSQDEANSSPPLPRALSPHYGTPENNSLLAGTAGPLMKEKPKRNGARGLEDVRPSVESLLDELESSVPSPV